MKDTKKVKVNGKTVEMKKLSIRQFGQLMMAIEKVPAKLGQLFTAEEFENLDNQMLLAKIPILIREVQDEFFNLVAIASGMEIVEIEELSIEEFIDVVTAILELNDFRAIFDKAKNVLTVLKVKQ